MVANHERVLAIRLVPWAAPLSAGVWRTEQDRTRVSSALGLRGSFNSRLQAPRSTEYVSEISLPAHPLLRRASEVLRSISQTGQTPGVDLSSVSTSVDGRQQELI